MELKHAKIIIKHADRTRKKVFFPLNSNYNEINTSAWFCNKRQKMNGVTQEEEKQKCRRRELLKCT